MSILPLVVEATLEAAGIYTPQSKATPGPTLALTTRATQVAGGAGFGSESILASSFESLGFSGSSSPLTDGTPRWLGRRSYDAAMVELIGPADGIDRMSITIASTTEQAETRGASLRAFLDAYAPSARDHVAELLQGMTSDLDETFHAGNASVHLATITASDGIVVTITLDHD